MELFILQPVILLLSVCPISALIYRTRSSRKPALWACLNCLL